MIVSQLTFWYNFILLKRTTINSNIKFMISGYIN